MAESTIDPKIVAFLHLLSRCDTLHDFVGSRSVLSKQEVLNILNKSELSEKKLAPLYNIVNKDEQYNIDGILNKTCAALININYPAHYTPKIIKRISGVKDFEPRVVLFYELYENILQNEFPNMNIGKYISYDYLPGYSFTDKLYKFGVDNGDSNNFNNATMAYVNLGCTMKTEKTEKTQETREASGLYSEQDKSKRFKNLSIIIKQFFSNVDKVCLIVDVSSVSLDDFNISNNTNEAMYIHCNIASDWDGAMKSKCGLADPEISQEINESKNLLERTLFGFSDIYLTLTDNIKTALLEKNNQKLKRNINDATVEVTPLSECIRDFKNKTEAAKSNKNKTEVKNCFLDNPKIGVQQMDLFDVKRTGDAYQVLMTKKLNENNTKNKKYVFVTVDHLAFLKARLNGVPSIFTNIDSLTRERIMFLYKPDVDVNDINNQFEKTLKMLNKTNVNINEYLVNPTKMFTKLEVEYDIPLVELVKIGKDSTNPTYTTRMLTWIDEIYNKKLSETQVKFDEMFNQLFTDKSELTTKLSNVITTYKEKLTKANSQCEDINDKLLRNIQKLATSNFLESRIFNIINYTWYIELMYLVKRFVSNRQNYIAENENVKTIIKECEDLSSHKEFVGKMNEMIPKMNKIISKYEYLNNITLQNLLGLEMKDYEIIIKRVTDIINGGMYAKRKDSLFKDSLHELIESTSKETPRKKVSRCSEIVKRFVTLMNKVVDTLVSFARVKTNSLPFEDVQMGDDNGHVRKYDEYLQKITKIAFGGAEKDDGNGMSERKQSQDGAVDETVWKSLFDLKEINENYENNLVNYIKEYQSKDDNSAEVVDHVDAIEKEHNDIYTRFRRFYNKSEDPKTYNQVSALVDHNDDSVEIVDHNDDIEDEYNYVRKYEEFIIKNLPQALLNYINEVYYSHSKQSSINKKAKELWDNELTIKVNELVGEALDTYFYLHPGYHALMQREATNLRPDEIFTLKMINDPKFYLTENYNIITGKYIMVEKQATDKTKLSLFRKLYRLGVNKKKITKTIRARPYRLPSNFILGGGISSFTMEDYCFKYYKPYYDMYYK